MKKILLLIAGLSIMFAACDYNTYDSCVWVCGVEDDGAGNATFKVCADSQSDIGGWQFSLDAGDDFTITSTDIGADAGFCLDTSDVNTGDTQDACSAPNTWSSFTNYGGSSLNLVFDLSGNYMAAGDGLEIATFTGTYTGSGNTDVVVSFGTGALSSPQAQPLTYQNIANVWVAGQSVLDAETPAEYSLKAAYPNPFNPTTTIEYNVEIAGNVNIAIFDITGREVKTLINEYVSPKIGGNYSVVWDGTNNSNAFVSTGVYVYRMMSNDFVKTQKMTLAK